MSEREQMEKVNFVKAKTPEDFFAYVEKVNALHKAREKENDDQQGQGQNRETGTGNDGGDSTTLQSEKATER